jgi:UrcA family protein
MLKPVLVTLPVLTALALATPAEAGPRKGAWQVGRDTMHLYYSDLDMNSAAGRRAMLGRVERAAERLCRDLDGGRGCVQRVVSDTLRQSANPHLELALAERDGVALAAR